MSVISSTEAPARARRRCPDGDHTGGLRDQEKVAERLLTASRRHSFDPDTEVNWDAPLAPDRFYLPPTTLSLYETYLWDGLSHRQQVELSKHEAASIAYMGIWFEVILMQILARHIYHRNMTSKHVAYALTEIADECRHSKMFARMVARFGTPRYQPPAATMIQGWLMKTVEGGPAAFAATLIVEEILDAVQRITFPDEDIQPLVRDVTRIHVIEEARHVTFAREELRRQMASASPARRESVRWVAGRVIQVVVNSLVHPRVYAGVGIDPREGRRVAKASPHRRATTAWSTRRMREFFTEVGVIGGPSAALWRTVGAC